MPCCWHVMVTVVTCFLFFYQIFASGAFPSSEVLASLLVCRLHQKIFLSADFVFITSFFLLSAYLFFISKGLRRCEQNDAHWCIQLYISLFLLFSGQCTFLLQSPLYSFCRMQQQLQLVGCVLNFKLETTQTNELSLRTSFLHCLHDNMTTWQHGNMVTW